MQRPGWDLDFVQLDRRALPVEALGCGSSSVSVLRVELGNHVHQLGRPPPGRLTFGVPAPDQGTIRVGTQEVASNSLLEFSGSGGLDVVGTGSFTGYTLSFEPERLSESARILGAPDIEKMTGNRQAVRYPDPVKLATLHHALTSLFQGAEQLPGPAAQPAFAAAIEFELPLIFKQCWDQSSSPDRVRTGHRLRVVRRAREYIEAHAQDPVTIADLCRAASCSVSTLGRAFREHLGVSPKYYLTAVRLAGVRRSLLTGAPRVGDAAADWGFWHLSKFTSIYKQTYGELPSVTRSRGAAGSGG